MKRMLLALVAAASTIAGVGCSSRTVYVRDDVPAPLPPPPPPKVVVIERPAPLEVLRADDIDAGHVAARVIYADVVYASSGNIGRIVETRGHGGGHGHGRNRGDLSASEIIVDEIHADEIHANYLEADIVYAGRVVIGSPHRAPDGNVRHRPDREARRPVEGGTVVVVERGRNHSPPTDTVVVVDRGRDDVRHRPSKGVKDDRNDKNDKKDKVKEAKERAKERAREKAKEKNDDDAPTGSGRTRA